MHIVHKERLRAWLSILRLLCLMWPFSLPLPAAADPSPTSSLLRILAPVRLSPSLGPDLDAEIVKTRAILDRFHAAGFQTAVWAVDRIPEDEKDINLWVETCLKAFPYKPILALDFRLTEGKPSPGNDAVASLLSACREGVQAVMVNYTHLNNYENVDNGRQAIEVVKANAALVRKTLPGVYTWLLLDDDPTSVERMPNWTRALGDLADGYWLYRWHEWDAANRPEYARPLEMFRRAGKPVVRGGFQYTCARVRPGIEDDIAQHYRRAIRTYETWLAGAAFEGFAREIGPGIPGRIGVNMDYVIRLEIEP